MCQVQHDLGAGVQAQEAPPQQDLHLLRQQHRGQVAPPGQKILFCFR